MKNTNKKLLTLGLPTILAVAIGLILFQQRTHQLSEKNFSIKVEKARTELSKVKENYLKRLDLIEQMASDKAFPSPTADEIKRKTQFLRQSKLDSQTELDQFDQMQNDLSNYVAEYFSKSSRSGKSSLTQEFLPKFQTLERSIEAARMNYTQLALSLNEQRRNQSYIQKKYSEMPVFKANALALETQNKKLK